MLWDTAAACLMPLLHGTAPSAQGPTKLRRTIWDPAKHPIPTYSAVWRKLDAGPQPSPRALGPIGLVVCAHVGAFVGHVVEEQVVQQQRGTTANHNEARDLIQVEYLLLAVHRRAVVATSCATQAASTSTAGLCTAQYNNMPQQGVGHSGLLVLVGTHAQTNCRGIHRRVRPH
jgi:hypothetical protein